MKRAVLMWEQTWPSVLVAFGAVLLGIALASPANKGVLIALAIALLVTLIITLPAHLFLGASLALLASFSAPAFEQRPFNVGSIQIYALDILLVSVLVRARLPRPRWNRDLRVLDVAVLVPAGLWAAVMLLAGFRGILAGNSLGAVARLEMFLFYFPLFWWGFMRIVQERSMSMPRIVRTLAVTALTFMAYAAFARLTHQRFGAETGAGIGGVSTTGGVLRRDYGFFSAFQLYALLALGGLAYLMFSQRATLRASLVATAGLAATILTLVRGLIFGTAAGAIVLLLMALKSRWQTRVFRRLLPLLALCALAAIPFSLTSPAVANGVVERVLPGITTQASGATANTEYREQVLAAGIEIASTQPFGLGFVSGAALEDAGYPPLYGPHSQWASLLVYTGWPGVFLLLWAGVSLVRRSAQLPAAAPWLHPLLTATVVLVAVQGFAWDVFFSQPWSLGMVALVFALRFGLVAGGRHG